MDELKAFHTEWNVREKQIFCINSYTMSCIWTYLQDKKRDNRCREWTSGHREVKGDSGTNWESSIDIYTLPCVA